MYTFFASDLTENSFQYLSESESHHAMHVLRLAVGDEIKIVDGNGNVALTIISEIHKKKCSVVIKDLYQEPKEMACSLHIAIAPVKSMDRFEWFLEKACEWGVDEISPVITKNSEREKLNMQKCESTLISALKQSGRAWKPVLHSLITFSEFIKSSETTVGQKCIAYCGNIEKQELLHTILKKKDVNILIGPEGDFTKTEIATALANNWTPVALGKYRLRTETAALESAVIFNLVNRL